MKKFLMIAALLGLAGCEPEMVHAFANPLSLTFGDNTFTAPLKHLDVTQLYSFKDGKGFPAVQSVVYSYRASVNVSIGGAPVIGTSNDVPFISTQFLLPKKAFDPAAGPIWLGVWYGRQFKSLVRGVAQKDFWGLNASIALW